MRWHSSGSALLLAGGGMCSRIALYAPHGPAHTRMRGITMPDTYETIREAATAIIVGM